MAFTKLRRVCKRIGKYLFAKNSNCWVKLVGFAVSTRGKNNSFSAAIKRERTCWYTTSYSNRAVTLSRDFNVMRKPAGAGPNRGDVSVTIAVSLIFDQLLSR